MTTIHVAPARFADMPRELRGGSQGKVGQLSWGPEFHGNQWTGPISGGKADEAKQSERAARDITMKGGGTLNPLTGDRPTKGYLVAQRFHSAFLNSAHMLSHPDELKSAVRDYVRQNVGAWKSGLYLGTWNDTEHGEVVLDRMMNPQGSEADATRLGGEHNQQAIWDLANDRPIDTGGSGDRPADGRGPTGANVVTVGPRGTSTTTTPTHSRLAATDRRGQLGRLRGRGVGDDPAGLARVGAGSDGVDEFAYDPDQPRDEHGRWTSGDVDAETGEKHAGTKDDPIPCHDDIGKAARLLEQGKAVTLHQPREVSTLLNRLAERAREAQSQGREAKNFDACNVSVPGTNLFCQDNLGIPRVRMPQLGGIPAPGSPADDESKYPKNADGEVDLSDAFVQYLQDKGVEATRTTVDASELRASQSQLNGQKVAGIMNSSTFDPQTSRPIFTTQDNYVIDGHHRWAATVGRELLSDDQPLTMPVMQLNVDIGTGLGMAEEYAHDMGVEPATVTSSGTAQFGDVPGHEFHGNQWTGGEGGGKESSGHNYEPQEWQRDLTRHPSPIGMSKFINEHLDSKPFTEDERAAMRSYQLDATNVETVARKGDDALSRVGASPTGKEPDLASVHATMDSLDRVLDNSRTTQDMTVYRGIRSSVGRLSSLKPGDSFSDSGYASTSPSEEEAAKFAARAVDTRAYIAEMRVPAGTPAVAIPNAVEGVDEGEVLLGRGTSWTVVDRVTDPPIKSYLTRDPLTVTRLVMEPTMIPGPHDSVTEQQPSSNTGTWQPGAG